MKFMERKFSMKVKNGAASYRGVSSPSSSSSPPGKSQQNRPGQPDLYDMSKLLLDRSISAADRQQILNTMEELLQSQPEVIAAWRGPETPLHFAVQAGQPDWIHVLIRGKANVNVRSDSGSTPLHLCVGLGSPSNCRILLEANASVEINDNQYQTPLFFCCDNDTCELLIDRRANVNAINNAGMSTLHVAALAGRVEIFGTLLAKMGKLALELRDADGVSALEYAQQCGIPVKVPAGKGSAASKRRQQTSKGGKGASGPSTKIAQSASAPARVQGLSPSDKSASPIYAHNTSNPQDLYSLCKPLLDVALGASVGAKAESTKNINLKAIQALLKADPDKANAWPLQGAPILAAAQADSLDLVRVLLQSRASPNAIDDCGATPLQFAACKGSVSVCAVLIAARAEVNQADSTGQTAMFFVQNAETARLLIQKGAKVNVKNGTGQTALHYAGEAGYMDVWKLISEEIDHSLIGSVDIKGKTAWDYVQQQSSSSNSSFQRPKMRNLGKESPRRQSAVTFADKPKGSPGLHLLMQRLMDESCSEEEEAQVLKSVQKLLTAVPQAACGWQSPSSPLQAAVWGQQPQLTQMLLQARANPCESDDPEGATLLQIAAMKGSAEICQDLLDAGALVNEVDSHGQTALFFANSRPVAETLLSARSNIAAFNRWGQSPLHTLGRAGLPEAFSFLWHRAPVKIQDARDADGHLAWDHARKAGLSHPEKKPKGGSNNSSPQSRGRSPQREEITPNTGTKLLLRQTRNEEKIDLSKLLGPLSPDSESTDLFDIVKPLFEPTATQADQSHALRAAQHLLRSGKKDASTWAGPGTPLAAAVQGGRTDLVRLLVRASADLNQENAKGVSLLHYAAFDGCTDMCICLLSQRANVHARDPQGQTPLFFAAETATVRLLMDYEADHNLRDTNGMTPLHNVAKAGIQDVFLWLYERTDETHRSMRDDAGINPCDYAAYSGILPDNFVSKEEAHTKAKSSRPSQVWTLRESKDMCLFSGIAEAQMDPAAVASLLEGIPLTVSGSLLTHCKIPMKGLRKKAYERNRGQGADTKRIKSLRCLSADSIRNNAGMVPMYASGWRCLSPDSGPGTRRAESPTSSRSPDSLASSRLWGSTRPCVSSPLRPDGRFKLQSRSPSPMSEKVSPRSNDKSSPGKNLPVQGLFEAAHVFLSEPVTPEEGEQGLSAARELVSAFGEPPDAWSGPGVPLLAAVTSANVEHSLAFADILLQAGANPNIYDSMKQSALMLATKAHDVEMCSALLAAKADANALDEQRQTPLFFAEDLNICRLLVKKRADFSVNECHESVLHIAARAGWAEVYTFLCSKASSTLRNLVDNTGSKAKDYAEKAGIPEPRPRLDIGISIRSVADLRTSDEDEEKEKRPKKRKPVTKAKTSGLPQYLDRILIATELNYPVMLLSESDQDFLVGAIKQCAREEKITPQVVCVPLHSHCTIAELYGSCKITTSEHSAFYPGILPLAVRDGHWLVFQGLNYAPDAVLHAIQDMLVQVFDSRPPFTTRSNQVLTIPGSASAAAASALEGPHVPPSVAGSLLSVQCHPNFRVFATAFKHRFSLSMSMWSHWIQIDLTLQVKRKAAEVVEAAAVAESPVAGRKIVTIIGVPPAAAAPAQVGGGGPTEVLLGAHRPVHNFLSKCRSTGRPGLIKGEQSSGKTVAWHIWASQQLGREGECIVVRLHLDTCAADLFGWHVFCGADKGECPFRWQDGPVSRAVKEGLPLLLCGLHLPHASALHCLASVLSSGQSGSILIGSALVPMHPDFSIFATARRGIALDPMLESLFEVLTWSGQMQQQDNAALTKGILSQAYLAYHNARLQGDVTTAMGSFLKEAESLAEKKPTVGRSARMLQRARSILERVNSTAMVSTNSKERTSKDPTSDSLSFSKKLIECEKDGLKDVSVCAPLAKALPALSPQLAGREDLMPILALLRAAGMPAVLQGPSNIGKMSAAVAFAKTVSWGRGASATPPVITMTKGIVPEDIFGCFKAIPGGGFEYRSSPLEMALREGHALVVNQINNAPPWVMSVLVDTLSYPPRVVNPITGKCIDVHPNFWFIGTLNYQQGTRCMIPDALRTRAIAVPMEKQGRAFTRNFIQNSPHFPSEVAPSTRDAMLDELFSESRASFDTRAYLKLVRRICGQASQHDSGANPTLSEDPESRSKRRQTLLRLQGSTDSGTDLMDFHGSTSAKSKFQARDDGKSNIQRLVQLHIEAFTALPPGTPCKIERTSDSSDKGESLWVFTIEERHPDPLKISVTFPAVQDDGAAAEVRALSDGQRAFLCQMAIALRYQEPICAVGPSSFKARMVTLLSQLIRFENFRSTLPPLNAPLVHRLTAVEDLVGGVEPHSGSSFAAYCRHLTRPLSSRPEPSGKTSVHQSLQDLNRLLSDVTAQLRKHSLQPDAATLGGRRIAESHKLMIAQVYELLKVFADKEKSENIFPVCERGIMQSIRFGGMCLLSQVQEVDAGVLGHVFNDIFEIGQDAYYHPGMPNGDRIDVHPQCFFVCTARTTEALGSGILNRLTCIKVPPPSPEDLAQAFQKTLSTALSHSHLGNEVTLAALQTKLLPVVRSLDTIRKATWIAGFAGALSVEPFQPRSPTLNSKSYTRIGGSLSAGQQRHSMAVMPDIAASAQAEVAQWLLTHADQQALPSAKWGSLACCRHKNPALWQLLGSNDSTRRMTWHLLAAAECQAYGLPHPVPVFVGAPGMGKTFICQQAAQCIGRTYVRIPCSAQTGLDDLFGTTMPNGGYPNRRPRNARGALTGSNADGEEGFTFRPGILVQAAQQSAVVLFDGLNLLQPQVLSALAGLFRCHTIIRVHDVEFNPRHCLFCGTMNPGDPSEGRNSLPLLVQDVVRVVHVEHGDADITSIMRKTWNKSMKVSTAFSCAKALRLNLRGVLRLSSMLPAQDDDRRTAWALRMNLPIDESSRIAASKRLGVVLSAVGMDSVADGFKAMASEGVETRESDLFEKVNVGDVLKVASVSASNTNAAYYPGIVLLTGPPCCGKRSVVRSAVQMIGYTSLVEIFLSKETTTADLLGEVAPASVPALMSNSKETEVSVDYVEGPLLRAVKQGWWCLIANIDRAPPEVLERLNSLGESPPSLVLLGQPGGGLDRYAVHVHKNFRLFCTVSTSSATPCYTVSKPFLDRCVNISFGVGADEKAVFIDEMLQKCEHNERVESRPKTLEVVEQVCAAHNAFMEEKGDSSSLLEGTAEDAARFLNLRGLERALAVCINPPSRCKVLEKAVLRAAYGGSETSGARAPSRWAIVRSAKLISQKDDKRKYPFLVEKSQILGPENVAFASMKEAIKQANVEAETAPGSPRKTAAAAKQADSKSEWVRKVEDFDKTAWRQGITLTQLNEFFVCLCGRDGSDLETDCERYNSNRMGGKGTEDIRADTYGVAAVHIKTLTAEKECSLAQFINPDGLDVSFYVCHAWNQLFVDMIHCLNCMVQDLYSNTNHPRKIKRKPGDASLWVCAAGLNQHFLQRSSHTDIHETLDWAVRPYSFVKVLEREPSGMLVLLDESCTALQRSWCLSEIWYAYRYGVPVDMWISGLDQIGEAIKNIDTENMQVYNGVDKAVIANDVERFEHNEFGAGFEGFTAFIKQMAWDMTLRFASSSGDTDAMSKALENEASGRRCGIGGLSVLVPLETSRLEERLQACRPVAETIARSLLKKRIVTSLLRVIVDNVFLGLGLHAKGAACVADILLCVLSILGSLRVDFEVVTAGDQRSGPCLLKSFEEQLSVKWHTILQGALGSGLPMRRPTSCSANTIVSVFMITTEGRGAKLQLDDGVTKLLSDSGVRRMGCCSLQTTPGAPAEFHIVDFHRTLKQIKAQRVSGPDPLSACLLSLLMKDGAKGDPGSAPMFNNEDFFFRKHHETAVHRLAVPLESNDAVGPEGSVKLLAATPDDLSAFEDIKLESPTKDQGSKDTRFSSRSKSPPSPRGPDPKNASKAKSPLSPRETRSPRDTRSPRITTTKGAASTVSKTTVRARDVAEKLRQHSLKATSRPGMTESVMTFWGELRDAFSKHVEQIAKGLERVSASYSIRSATQLCHGTGFNLSKTVKWFATNGTTSDVWEPKPLFGVVGSLVMIVDTSGAQSCNISGLVASAAFACESCNVPLGVLRWDHQGVQLVKPAPDRSTENVRRKSTSTWDTASKSSFLRTIADAQNPHKMRLGTARFSDTLLAASALLAEGDYPAPRRVMLVPAGFDPKDHRALLRAWTHCEEVAGARCTAVCMCATAGPLPRSIVLGKPLSPPTAAHVICTVFSNDAPYTPASRIDTPAQEWTLQENEVLGVLPGVQIPSVVPNAPATSADFEYEADVNVEDFYKAVRDLERNGPEDGHWEPGRNGTVSEEEDGQPRSRKAKKLGRQNTKMKARLTKKKTRMAPAAMASSVASSDLNGTMLAETTSNFDGKGASEPMIQSATI